MLIQSLTFNPLQENTYIISNDAGDCLIIDPGCCDKEEERELKDFVESQNLKVKAVWNTHVHIDHVLGNSFCCNQWNVPLYIPELEQDMYRAVKVYAPNYGFFTYQEASVSGLLSAQKSLPISGFELNILFVPGHSPGHLAFYDEKGKQLVSGDVLFYESIGRSDLPGGQHETLLKSIREQLFSLPDEVTVHPGHGPKTSIGHEKRFNPFCAI
jgi:hydroxyacylglutathione hydrolase